MKITITLATIIVFGLTVWYFSHQQKSEKYNDRLQKITIGNVVGYPNLAIIAKEKGYFEENNLDVTFVDYENPMIQELIDGKIDIVSATAEFVVVKNILEEKDLKIMASVSKQQSQWEILTRLDKNIQSPADLKGKTIAVQRGTIGEFFLAEFLLFNNLQPSDVSIIDLALQPRMEQFSLGQIDAVVLLSPYTQQLQHALDNKVIRWPAQAGRNIYSLTYTTDGYAQENPDNIENYLKALLEAEAFINANNVEARAIIQNHLHFSDADIQALWPLFNFEVKLDQELLPVMEDQTRWTIGNHSTPQTGIPDYLDFIYFDGLEKVKPEAVTMIH